MRSEFEWRVKDSQGENIYKGIILVLLEIFLLLKAMVLKLVNDRYTTAI